MQGVALLAALAGTASGHAVISAVIGTSGPQGIGLGVSASVIPCQQDSPIMRDAENASNNFGSCGRTQAGGNIDTSTAIEQHLEAKMVAEVTKGSVVTLQLHQVNGDGAGPYSCGIDPLATGAAFRELEVLKQVPGALGLNSVRQTGYDLKVKLPDDLECVGGSTGRVCVLRCRNAAFSGPFGGCVPLAQTDGKGRTDPTPGGIKLRAKIESIERQRVEGVAQLRAMKLDAMAGVVSPAIAPREQDGMMQLSEGETAPDGAKVERVTAAFIPVNIPQKIPDPTDAELKQLKDLSQPTPSQLAAIGKRQ